jgi:hypothetical protein
MYHKDVFKMKALNFLLALIISFSIVAESEFDIEHLQGEWYCTQIFELTDNVEFKASHISHYSFDDKIVISKGTITTSSIDSPNTKSILAVRYSSLFAIDARQITFKPQKIDANIEKNDLGDLSDEFVRGFKAYKKESSANIDLLTDTDLVLSYSNGTNTKCLRK